MKFLLLLISLSILLTTNAHAGQDKGNGGDTCEKDFQIIRNDILSWINQGGGSKLKLGKKINAKEYTFQMKKFISTAKVSCTNKVLLVGKAEKTCKNFIEKGSPRILCNSSRFSEMTLDDQYILVHHEYAGLSGYEVNNGEESIYPISNQISSYLEEKIVKKLAIKIDDSLEKKTLEKFLLEANNPKSEIGKLIAVINEENKDGRNQDGIISLPVKKNDVQISIINTEEIYDVWKYAANNGTLGCTGTSQTSGFIVSLSSHTGVSSAGYMEKYNFTVKSRILNNIKRLDGEPLEHCDESMDSSDVKYVFSNKIEIGKFKELIIVIPEEIEN